MSDGKHNTRTFRLGTRGSQLARWQAEWVAAELRRRGHSVVLVEIATRGDVDRTTAIEDIGTRGVFTKEIQRALLAGDIDLGVHSLKDLPTEPVEGLAVAAVPERESVADVIVCRQTVAAAPVDQAPASNSAVTSKDAKRNVLDLVLPPAARVGTGSLRRQAQLRHLRPDLRTSDIRGNVDTRLRKLDEGEFDAIVLAEAGLRRLGLEHRISRRLPVEIMLPAVGQGALGIECRADDAVTLDMLAPLEDAAARAAVTAERALLSRLRAGCMAPVGAWGQVVSSQLQLAAVVLSADGRQRIALHDSGRSSDATSLGENLAMALIARGADRLIAAARSS